MKKILLLLPFVCFGIVLHVDAQRPSTDIYILKVKKEKSKWSFGKPYRISNHAGYNNQPVFSPDGKQVIYVSMPDTMQTELFSYTLDDSTTHQLTNTPESEYSPNYFQGGSSLSVVRVDADMSQHLYEVTEDFTAFNDLAPGLDSIGYYCWLNDSTFALAILHNGLDLLLYERFNDQYVLMDQGIGRCLLHIPGSSDLMYLKNAGDSTVSLMTCNAERMEKSPLATGMKNTEDYCFLPDRTLLCGKDGKLFASDPFSGSAWVQVADFSVTVGLFYRIVVNPEGTWMALVVYSGKRP